MFNLYDSTTFTNVIPHHIFLQSLIIFGKHSKVESVNTVVANVTNETKCHYVCLYAPLCVWDIPVFLLCADLKLIDCQRITWLSHDKYERKKGFWRYWCINLSSPKLLVSNLFVTWYIQCQQRNQKSDFLRCLHVLIVVPSCAKGLCKRNYSKIDHKICHDSFQHFVNTSHSQSVT